jgi:prepilin-type N-terminal cleavage/methylation domain-containing protein
MKTIRSKQFANAGYTLVEVAMVIAILALLGSFAIISFGNAGEQRDAAMIQSAQASLQSIISQGAVRMDMRPDDLATTNPAAVINAVNAVIGSANGQNRGVTFRANQYPYRMTIASTGSWVEYVVQNGDVLISQISPNLSAKGYSIQNGILVKYP